MNEFDEDRARELKRVMNDPNTDEQTKLDCADELHDMCGRERVEEFAQLDAYDALEVMKNLAKTATAPEVRRQAAQSVEQYERAREAQIRKVTGDDAQLDGQEDDE